MTAHNKKGLAKAILYLGAIFVIRFIAMFFAVSSLVGGYRELGRDITTLDFIRGDSLWIIFLLLWVGATVWAVKTLREKTNEKA